MKVVATEKFADLYKKMPLDIQDQADKALHRLELQPFYPSLGHKKIAGYEDIYEIRVSKNYRITYQKIGDTAYLRKIGTHDLLKNP